MLFPRFLSHNGLFSQQSHYSYFIHYSQESLFITRQIRLIKADLFAVERKANEKLNILCALRDSAVIIIIYHLLKS